MKTLLIFALIVSALLVRCSVMESNEKERIANRPSMNLTLRQIYAKYRENPVRAKASMEDHNIVFTAKITKVELDGFDNPLLTLVDTSPAPTKKPTNSGDNLNVIFDAIAEVQDIPTITARFKEREARSVARWNVGQTVRVACDHVAYQSGGFSRSLLGEGCFVPTK